MALNPGDKLGPYEIVSALGKGGMGEVWRARDTRLNRDVAIKVSALQFTDRFEREARAIAALNHPNICTLFDVGPNYLVMELVEGPTLAERILEGPVPLDQALHIAKQIADALEAAHNSRIVHRDLKPANVKIKPDGKVKVLDFGLAKAGAQSELTSDSPTMMPSTEMGMILGTAGYMAPEQARGKPVDKRADIWAFGVVLYEMVAGERLFKGETVSDILAEVIRDEPDWSKVSVTLRPLLRRCLEKDPNKRLRDISGVELLLDAELAPPAPTPSQKASRLGMAGWIAAGVFVLAAAGLTFVHFRPAPPAQVLRFTLPPGDGTFVAAGPPAVSPDGHRIAYVSRVEGRNELWVRDLDSLAARRLFTEDVRFPFWSPDSRSIGFFSGRKLKRVDAAGGPALTLCDALQGWGGTWNRDGVILFSPSSSGPVLRVPASGGNPSPVSVVDKTLGERTHHNPGFLPDGRHFLYTALADDLDKTGIYIGDLKSRDRRRLAFMKSNVEYVSPGYLLFLRDRALMAQPFDAEKLEIQGDPFPIAEDVDRTGFTTGQFSASPSGVLVYISGTLRSLQLTWLDHSGRPSGMVGGPGEIDSPAISPDGGVVAFDRQDEQTGLLDIWLHDLARGTDSRFTFSSQKNQDPVWSPDGNYIAFDSNRSGHASVYRKATGGTGQDEVVDKDEYVKFPTGWSPDGHYLFESTSFNTPKTGSDIWVAPMEPGGKPYPYLRTEFNEGLARLSPNGRWLAYSSNETKRYEVYVMTFPNPGGKWQISTSGGTYPVWSRDGKELFFISADSKMMAVGIKGIGNKLEAGVPQALFDIRGAPGASFDVSKDGKFLIPMPAAQTARVPMTVVVNWSAGLKK